jgi:hypothetical protein
MTKDALKQAVKEALAEMIREQRRVFVEIIRDAREDLAMASAIEEGLQTRRVSRAEVFRILHDKS